jgi:hypothetical protein
MDIQTKYNVGQPVFFVNCHNGQCRVELENIKEIHIGGNINDAYKFGIYSRSERDIYTNFDEAKKKCIDEQEMVNENSLKICKKQIEPHP